MDFSNRGSQQSPAAPRTGTPFSPENTPAKTGSKGPKFTRNSKWTKLGMGALLVAFGILIAAVLGATVLSNWSKGEAGLVASDKYQAVFLTNDQVYFGRISELNSRYLVLNDIYYLRTQSTSATTTATDNSNVSLVKLGCELHKPYDKMVINRSQVQFWENLQDSGQVATAVKQYQKQNPTNTCSNTATGGASSSTVQGSTTPTTTKQ